MRVTFVAAGTEGDIQPLLAIGRGLRQRRHEVRFASVPVFHDLVRRSGLEPVALGDYDPRQVTIDIARSNPRQNRLLTVRQRLTPEIPSQGTLAQLVSACEGADAVVYTPISGLAYHVAEAHNARAFEVQLLPLTPTRMFPSPLTPLPNGAGGHANLVSYHGLSTFFWLVNHRWANDWRRLTLGLRPLPLTGPAGTSFFRRSRTVICAVSPSVVTKPRDWPDTTAITGYLFAPSPPYSAPLNLVAFLEGGDPPVCISFGSTVESDPHALRPILVEAQKRTGRRFVVVKGWANYDLPDSSQHFFVVDRASYEWLYPRVGAVVHHAGTGTAAEAIRAGVPSISVPRITEQRFWGTRLWELGVSPPPIVRRALTADRLARAIEAAGDPGMIARVRALGSAVRAEDGISAAIDVIERALSRAAS